MAQDYDTLMEALSQQEDALQSQLQSSPTAYSANVSPLSSDIQTQLDLMKVKKKREAARSKEIQERWYAEPEQRVPIENKGFISRAFNFLGTPLYAIVGGVEAVLGKGTKKGPANIIENIRERETFGDLMRKYGVSNFAALPIGLALDIALDPINWTVAGTAATIPRLVKGGLAAGVKGVGVAAKSSVLSKASIVSKLLPSSKKIAGTTEDVGRLKSLLQKSSEFKESLAKKAYASKERFSELQGLTLQQEALRKGVLSKGWASVGAVTRALVEKSPGPIKSFVKSITPESGWFARQLNLKYGKQPTSIADDAKSFNFVDDQKSLYKKDMNRQLDEAARMATDDVDLTRGRNATEIAARTADEANQAASFREGTQAIIAPIIADETTGIKWFDNWSKWINNFTVKDVEAGKALIKPYQWYTSLFRTGVIGGSISAHLNAIVGNTFFTSMIGVNVASRQLLKSVGGAYNVLKGKYSGQFVDDILSDPNWRNLLENNPDIFQMVTGVDANMFVRLETVGKQIKAEKYFAKSIQDAKSKLGRSLVGAERGAEITTGAMKSSAKAITGEATNIPERLITQARTGATSAGAQTTGISQEVIRQGTAPTKWLVATQEKIANGTATKFEKSLYWYMTAPLKQYEKYDMSFKFGLAKHLSLNGVSAEEINKIGRFIDLSSDVIKVEGKDLFKLLPMKALEVSLEVYMNYSAMPAGIRMLRAMPFFGATFASFMYAMGVKTIKTMGYNPAFFNNVQFALHEISGGKSPLERVALSEPYGQYYQQEGMMKLPFFQENPVYANLANMMPFYTMNIFQEPKRGRTDYQKTLGDQVASIVDRLPMMKTPEGQIMFDYLILPYILRETNPKGAFDQQLFPKEPSLAERAGYTARAAIEPLVPSVLGLAAGIPTGLAARGTPELISAIPNFRWRQLAYATQGKKSMGDIGRESPWSRTARTISSTAGLPWYNLNLQYTNKK